MTHSELETKAREILKAIKQHCSPTYDRGDGHGQPGSILWRSSEPYVIAILCNALATKPLQAIVSEPEENYE